ncbi:TetR/AcrR family transcriptional regulator [Telmatospirillum sp. J64-1]|uniref:TetR/AcrR family transcriptional regulator n=1 Tax=Telmatospirillum sp. J64-1 TaxID=2502183 RepID=UPI00115EB12D|nr:TetR/AcrR family transcriptional regulator [Telmatospirillum sp. J64-1]
MLKSENKTVRRGRPSSRQKVLEAAAEIAAEVGTARLTLDAVAERAGVSKGGLLYNFPTKEELLRGMVDQFLEQTAELEQKARESLEPGPNLALRAALKARLYAPAVDRKAAASMLAAIAENPRLLDPCRTVQQCQLADFAEESDDPDMAHILWLAVEGLMLLDMMGMEPFDSAKRQAIAERILALAGDRKADGQKK